MDDKELYKHYTLEKIIWFSEHDIRPVIHNGYVIGWEVDG